MFVIDAGWYFACYADLICLGIGLGIGDGLSQSAPIISISTQSNCHHSFMVKKVMFHFAEATIAID